MKRFPLIVSVVLMAAVSAAAVQKTQPRVDEISLQGWQGMGRDGDLVGPGFKITLRRDGTALFKGEASVKPIGDFQGIISSAEFEKLLTFLVARKYDRIPQDPVNRDQITPAAGSARFTWDRGAPYMITSVVYEGGKTKNIFRPTTAWGIDLKHLPKELFEIEQAVYDAATRIRWAKIK